jgi:hypothetical protein
MTPARRLATSTASMLAIAWLCSCGPKGPREADPAPAFAIAAPVVPEGSLAATDVVRFGGGQREFGVLGDDGQIDARVVIRTQDTDRFNAVIAVSDGDARAEYLAVDESGAIVLTAVIEYDDQAISLFQPPLTIMPATLRAGESHESSAAMRVVHLDKPEQTRESGRARRTITCAGRQRITTPGGEVDAIRLDIEFTADLRLADAAETTTMWVLPAFGVLAEESSETVKVLGAFGSTTRRTIVLLEPPPGVSVMPAPR